MLLLKLTTDSFYFNTHLDTLGYFASYFNLWVKKAKEANVNSTFDMLNWVPCETLR